MTSRVVTRESRPGPRVTLDEMSIRAIAPLGVSLFAALAAGTGCSSAVDPGVVTLADGLRAATPDDQRVALEADLDMLVALDRDEKIGPAERRALLDLYRSASRDGGIDDDERALLARLTRDVVAAGGNVQSRKTEDNR